MHQKIKISIHILSLQTQAQLNIGYMLNVDSAFYLIVLELLRSDVVAPESHEATKNAAQSAMDLKTFLAIYIKIKPSSDVTNGIPYLDLVT